MLFTDDLTLWRQKLQLARSKSLKLEAILRGCKPLMVTEEATLLLCPYDFHLGALDQFRSQLLAIFGKIWLYRTVDKYSEEMQQDPIVQWALKELGAQISTGEQQ